MAFLRRIKQSDINFLSKQFLRSYSQNYSPFRANYSYGKIFALDYQSLPIQKCQFELPSSVRFFAAPVQAKPKREEKDTGPRLNEQITANVVRLVTDEGHHVVPKQEALRHARNLNLDLVEVQRNAKPPVCKVMDYNREKYQQELKEKDRAKSKSEGTLRKGACKEIRFSGNITQKDLQIKVDTAKRLMERGHRVKFQAKGNKTKDGEGEDSATLLSRICALIEDISVVESDTRVEDKDQAHIIVRHIKYGPTKKGSVKKGSKGNKSVTANAEEVESEDDVLSEGKPDEAVEETEKAGWKFDDANDHFGTIFEPDGANVAVNLSNGKLPFALESSSSSSGVSSRYANSFPSLDSARRPATSSTSVVGTENRYVKDPRNSSPHRSPSVASRHGERNNAQSGFQFSGSGSRPQVNANTSPIGRETEYRENESSTFQNCEIFTQVDNNAPGKQSSPVETNRYQRRNPSDAGGHMARRVGATPSPRF